jgi:cytochrome b561
MKVSSSKNTFGNIAKAFHWTIFFLFLFQFGIAIVMNGVMTDDYYPASLFVTHKSIGVTLFFLAVSRLLWRKLNPLPAWPDSMTEFEMKAFHFLEIGLYTVMFLMPLSGYIYSLAGGHGFKFFGLFEIPDLVGKNLFLSEIGKYFHRITAFIIVGLVASHVSLILRRHFDAKERFIDRMSFIQSDSAKGNKK